MKKTIKSIQTLLLLILILITILAYWETQENNFIILDDIAYISENPHVSSGITFQNIKWAFSPYYACNWHPLTWLSHMLDCELYGINPKGHHLNNLLFHLINTLLLFFILNRMTNAFWQSIFVASLFALHPLNVESVAWASERKNVLSTFFWISSIYAYIRYTEKRTLVRYFLILFLFGLGLMSKAILVTLPFVLLLLDIWPLDRFKDNSLSTLDSAKLKIPTIPNKKRCGCLYIFIEKVPLFLFSAGASVLTIIAQRNCSAIKSLESIPFKIRIANAVISYKDYIIKMLWPRHLAFLYPHPGDTISFSEAIWSGIMLTIITFLILYYSIRYKYLFVGWFWYLGTLIPVIGLIQTGSQQMADRYAYIPLIGLFIIFTWGVPSFFPKLRSREKLLAVLITSILLLLATQTYKQVQFWKDSRSIFAHALEVTSDNYLAHYNLGVISSGESDFKGALTHFNAALKIKPNFADAHYNLGNAFMKKGILKEAIFHYSESIRINPIDANAHNNLGIAYAYNNDFNKAISHFSEALSINPDYKEAKINLAITLENKKMINKN